jgi:methylated-DNA-[protein]-cysteine S-methyltransferase
MTSATYYARMPSPVGPLLLVATGRALSGVWLPSGRDRLEPGPGWIETAAPFAEAVRQLDAYFAGTLRRFDLALAPEGTPFQQRVWRALLDIPYGETVSYGELARRIGRPAAVRAVGAANGQNPLAIVIPCHRVIGSDGRLVGYGGGLAMKAALLELERRALRPSGDPRQAPLFPTTEPWRT